MGGIMSDDKKDLTKITDLSEFIHQDDPDIDAQLTSGAPEEDGPPETPSEEMASLDDLDDDENDGSFEEASFDSDDSEDSDAGFGEEESTFGEDSDDSFGDDSDNDEEASFGDDDTSFGESEDDAGFEEASFDSDDDNNSFGGDEEASFDSEESSFGEDDNSFGESEDSDDNEMSFDSDDSFGDDSDNEEEASFDNPEMDTPDLPDEPEEASFDSEDSEDSEDTVFDEPEVMAETEPEPTPTPPPPAPKESFEEVKQFAKNISYGVVAAGGNPPYSLIIKNIRFKEDAEDILIILREHGLCNDGNEETMKQGLDNGSVLISQISEYSAIYLAHRMRRFNVELLVGLSEELHPSKTYDKTNIGLVTKKTLKKNRRDNLDLSDKPVSLDNILMATTPGLENYVVKKYISIATEHRVIDETELEVLQHAKADQDESKEKVPREEFNYFDKNEDELLADISLGLDEVYQELAGGLKSQCLKAGGNAVIGINFQLTPLVVKTGDQPGVKYKITATGNIVWVIDSGRPGLEL